MRASGGGGRKSSVSCQRVTATIARAFPLWCEPRLLLGLPSPSLAPARPSSRRGASGRARAGAEDALRQQRCAPPHSALPAPRPRSAERPDPPDPAPAPPVMSSPQHPLTQPRTDTLPNPIRQARWSTGARYGVRAYSRTCSGASSTSSSRCEWPDIPRTRHRAPFFLPLAFVRSDGAPRDSRNLTADPVVPAAQFPNDDRPRVRG